MARSQPKNVYPKLSREFAGATLVYLPSVSILRSQQFAGTIGSGTPAAGHSWGARVLRLQSARVDLTGTKALNFSTAGMTILAVGAYHSQPGVNIESLVNRSDGTSVGGFDVAITNKWAGAGQHKVYCAYYKPTVGQVAFDSAWINGVKDASTNGNGSYDTVIDKRYVLAITTATGPAAHATVDLNVGQNNGISNDSSIELVVVWNRAFSEQQLRRISADPYAVFRDTNRRVALFAAPSVGAYTLSAASGSFALTGVNAGVRAARNLAAGAGTYALTGQAAGVRATRKVTAAPGTFSFTGQAAALKVSRKLTAGTGAYSLSGQAAGPSYGRNLAAGIGTFAFIGQPASLLYRRTLAAGAGTFVLSGQNAAFPISRRLTAGTGVYALSGNSVQFSGLVVLAAQTGVYALSGQTAGLLYSRIMPAGAGAFELTGIDVGLHASRILSTQSGSFSLSGQPAAFSIGVAGGTGASAADVWNYVLSNGKTAGQNVVEIRSMLDLLAPGFWNLAIEGTYTAADLLRVIAAVQAGKSTITALGGGAATVEFRAADDSETRVTATMNGSERTEVTLNVD